MQDTITGPVGPTGPLSLEETIQEYQALDMLVAKDESDPNADEPYNRNFSSTHAYHRHLLVNCARRLANREGR